MEPKDFIIGVDMDDTIENLMDAWVNWLNKKHNLSVHPNEIDEWEVKKFFPTLSEEELYEPLYNEEFWKTVLPKKDAQKYLKKLYDEGFTIYIVTCSHYNSLQPKVVHCLLKYFPFIDWRQIISIRNKQLLKLDILVDDYHKNLVNGSYRGLLVNRPYNQDFDTTDKNIIRVHNWEQIYNEIKSYYEETKETEEFFNIR